MPCASSKLLDEEIAASDQLVEAFHELVGDLPGVAIEHDGDAVGLVNHWIRAAPVPRPM